MLRKFFSLKDLDYLLFLRFVMIVFVMRQHLEGKLPLKYLFGFRIDWLWLGKVGIGEYAVIFFFTLSAFLNTKNLLNKFDWPNIKTYYIKKISGIVPLFYLTNFIYLYFVYDDYFKNYQSRIFEIFTFRYFLEFPFNQVVWFINIELLFLLILPIIIKIFYKFKFRIDLIASVVLTLFILYLTHPADNSYYKLQMILPIFAVAIYRLLNDLAGFFKNFINHKIVFYILFIISILFTIYPWSESKFRISLFLIPVYTILIIMNNEIFTFIKKEINYKNCLASLGNFFNYLGELTYGIFLIHMLVIMKFINPIEIFWNEFFQIFAITPNEYLFKLFIFASVLVASIFLSMFLYELFQKPVYNFLVNGKKRDPHS